jgi:endonuclease G, mitochondrial
MKNFIILILLLSVTSTSYAAKKCKSTFYDVASISGYNHLWYAPAESERLFISPTYAASIDGDDDDDSQFGGDYDGDYQVQPQWVAVHVKAYKKNEYAPGWGRPTWYRSEIFDEERLEFGTNKRVNNSYTGIAKTWNRGHLAQRADANRMGPEYGCNTHSFTNAFPQHADFNQGIWLGLESYLSGFANEKGEIWIISGPIFDDVSTTIGDAGEILIPIPQKAFKVVVWEENGETDVMAFIYPNIANHPNYKSGRCKSDKNYDHTPFLYSVAAVEKATGLTFFYDFSKGDQKILKQSRYTELPKLKAENRVGDC